MRSSITKALINEVGQAIRRNRSIRRLLPGENRLHIERQFPFLCVYRRPLDREDSGTEKLVLGEAAYLLAPSQQRHYASLQKLVEEIARQGCELFDAFLLLELWSAPSVDPDSGRFRIVAPNRGAPKSTLETLESELAGMRLRSQPHHVEVAYRDAVTPPGLPPLYTGADPRVITLGLEVPPLYRDAASGALLPFALRRLHHELARALKRSFYCFTHSETPHRPRHFLELGRRAMTRAVSQCDQRLATISRSFDLLLHVTPVNAPQAWEQFRKAGFERDPEFLYRPRPFDPALMKRQLFGIPLERVEDPTLAAILMAKQDELDRQITLVADRNTTRFMAGSRQIYGDSNADLLALAETILAQLPPAEEDDGSESLDAETFAAMARDEVAWYHRQDPTFKTRVEVRDDITGILVSKGNFLIGRDVTMVRARVEATLAHEIGTHALTYHNGSQQPLHEFYSGMAGYEPLQEGIAVVAEYLVGGLTRPRLRLLAARVMAVAQMTGGAGFIDTFRLLHRDYRFSHRSAFTIAMRVYRGGGYTKDAVYLRGLTELLAYLGSGGDFASLLVGKVTQEQLPLIEELRWREVIAAPRLWPRYWQSEAAQQRLARLRSGLSALELVEAQQ